MFDIEAYDYALPPGLIAQEPAAHRDHSRLLMVDRRTRAFSAHRFRDLPALLRANDLLVVNDTRVVPARLFGRKDSGGRVEVLVLEHGDGGRSDTRVCLLRTSKPAREGSRILFTEGAEAQILERLKDGCVKVRFRGCPVDELLERQGRVPLPPYIRRTAPSGPEDADRERYQTVYSRHRGAVAAPTAGLHFTPGLLGNLQAAGIGMTAITLHVGYGTFRPVRTRDIRRHELGGEFYRVPPEAARAVARTRRAGGRVVAVGTTAVRTLETAVDGRGGIRAREGMTDLMIVPGFSFQVVDALITNFHLPRSSLLFLTAAFAGLELIKAAYAHAVAQAYRFYSYGDAMLIL